jgi:predicted DNA-binding transcriptional regulator YafY
VREVRGTVPSHADPSDDLSDLFLSELARDRRPPSEATGRVMRKRGPSKRVLADADDAFEARAPMDIRYLSKKSGGVIERTIRPYEMKNGYLYATDTLHGAGQIHAFIVDRILDSAVDESRTFRPRWPVVGRVVEPPSKKQSR